MSWPKRIECECIIKGCNKPFKARGLCGSHYKLWRLNGSPWSRKRAPNGSGCLEPSGYIQFRGMNGGKGMRGHIVAAERALGKKLPFGCRVHHVNEVRSDNSPENLVICPDEAYHKLLHVRTRALNECGNANWIRCAYCRKYDDPKNIKNYKNNNTKWHPECRTKHNKELYASR